MPGFVTLVTAKADRRFSCLAKITSITVIDLTTLNHPLHHPLLPNTYVVIRTRFDDILRVSDNIRYVCEHQ